MEAFTAFVIITASKRYPLSRKPGYPGVGFGTLQSNLQDARCLIGPGRSTSPSITAARLVASLKLRFVLARFDTGCPNAGAGRPWHREACLEAFGGL